MHNTFTPYNISLDIDSSSENDSSSTASDIDLLNPKVHHQKRQHLFVKKINQNYVKSRTKSSDKKLIFNKKTFTTEEKYNCDEPAGVGQVGIKRSNWKLRKEEEEEEGSGVPQTLVIRHNSTSRKSKEKEESVGNLWDKSLKKSESKHSVTVLYERFQSACQGGDSLSSRSSSNTFIGGKTSTIETIVKVKSDQDEETPEKESSNPSPRIGERTRRRIKRKSNRKSKKHEPFNVNIEEVQRCRRCKPDREDKLKRMSRHLESLPESLKSSDKITFPFNKQNNNKVQFQSKKVDILVDNPQQTKVQVNLSNVNNQKVPPSLTKSTINQFKTNQQSILKGNIPINLTKHFTKPFVNKFKSHEMDVKTNCNRFSSSNEMSLFNLGISNDDPIDWNNVTLPEKTNLYEELARRIINYKNADCIVKIKTDEFHCHLLVLQSYSTFFDEKNSKDIDLSETSVTSRAFSIIYDWMISPMNDSCQLLKRDNILEIFTAAQFLEIKELEEQCWAFIDNNELFTEDTAFLLYCEARKIGNTAVMELMVPRIMKFFLLLVSTKDFLELSVDELCLLLRSNYICVNSEMEILMSAVRWLMFNWDERKQYLLDVMKCIRFGLITPWQLIDIKRNPENPEFMELMSYPEVQKMVDDGLAFVIIKYYYGNQNENYYHLIDLLGLNEPTNRNWAGDDRNHVTYREFLLYLEEYQRIMMPQLKLKRNFGIKKLPKGNEMNQIKAQMNYSNHSIGHNLLPSQINNGLAGKFSKIHLSTPNHQASPAVGIPPEILTKYFTTSNNNFKSELKQNDKISRVKFEDSNVKVTEMRVDDKIRKTISEDNEKTRKVAELLSAENKLEKPNRLPSNLTTKLVESQERRFHPYNPLKTKINQCYNSNQDLPRILYNVESIYRREKLLKESFDFADTLSTSEFDETDDFSSESQFHYRNSINWRQGMICSSIFLDNDESILVIGGIDPHEVYGVEGNTGKDIYRFKLLENVWELVGEIPEPRHHHSVVYLKGLVYLVGGADPKKGLAVATVWSYDPVIKKWMIEPDMMTPRRNFGLVISDEKIFAIGGQDANGVALKSVEMFDPAERIWRKIESMSIGRIGAACATYQRLIWVAGGQSKSLKEPLLQDVECYDPIKKCWFKITPLQSPRCFATLNVICDCLYLIGGAGRPLQNENMTESTDSIEQWNPNLKLWNQIAKIKIGRHSHSSSSIGSQLFIIGGVTTVYMKTLKSVECFSHEIFKCQKNINSLPFPVAGHASITLPPS